MSFFNKILFNLPEVAGPKQKKLTFKEKLKWTGIILILFFILGLIPLFGLGQNALSRFELLSVILGASFGSIISLGIGPIVTASIVLQLLNGSGYCAQHRPKNSNCFVLSHRRLLIAKTGITFSHRSARKFSEFYPNPQSPRRIVRLSPLLIPPSFVVLWEYHTFSTR